MTAWSPTSPERFGSLLAAARNGSREALGELFESCKRYLLAIANETAPVEQAGKVGASDLVQETFVKVQRAFDQFEGSTEAELLAWLRTTLLRTRLNLQSAQHAQKRGGDPTISLAAPGGARAGVGDAVDSADTPSEQLMAREEAEALDRAIGQLSPEYQEVIRLRITEGLPFDEVGRRMGRSEEAARKLLARATVQLGSLLPPP